MNKIMKTKYKFNNDIIVFSHLRWEFVFQRPQHLLTRLSKNRRIIFIEEPIEFNNENKGDTKVIQHENITILQPRISRENLIEEVESIIKEYSQLLNLHNPIFWFYSPEFVNIIHKIPSFYIVYDCMDQLTAFKGASSKLLAQEQDLLRFADIVFTGGKSLYEEKKKYNENTYCFPSSVAREHFEKANNILTQIPSDIKKLKKPIVGYYGVIDERIDFKLIKKTAQLMPNVSFVMIGPIVKISNEDLALNKNIYYLGAKSYNELPNYLKKIDVAMMPFALNKSTRFISPTKTLEYMAAGKPIISTRIKDVERDYSSIIDIIITENDFVNSIQKYLTESTNQAKKRLTLYNKVLNNTSWDKTSVSMLDIISEKLDVQNYTNSLEKIIVYKQNWN